MAKFNDGRFGSFEVAKKVGVSLERLRYWERLGVIKPNYIQCRTRKFRRYFEEDIHKAIFIKLLVDEEGYSLEGAIRKLKERKKQTGS